MSIESAKAFLEKVKSDEDLLAKLSDATGGEDRLNIAKSEGFEFSKEEMLKVQEELGDKELASVVGGRTKIVCPKDGWCVSECGWRSTCSDMS